MKSYFWKAFVAIVLACLLGFLYYKSTAVDPDRHMLVTAQLRQLRQLDAMLNQYILQARYRMLNNYDPLVVTQRHIMDVLEDLRILRPDIFVTGNPLGNKIESYLAARQAKNELIEEFKSQNSVLRNSGRYFPVVTQDLLEGKDHLADGDHMEVLVRDTLLHHMLIYQVTPSEPDRQVIMDALTAIKQKVGRYKPTQQQYLSSIMLHAGVMVTYKDMTDLTITKILNSPTMALGDEIFNLYGEEFERTDHEANLYRTWLLLFALSGLLYGAYSFIRISQARAEIKKSLSELEFQKFALDQHSIVSIADRGGRIIYINNKFCQISQYSPEELLGKDHRLLNSGYHSSEYFKEMWSAITRGQVWKGEVRNRKKDGSFYWVDSTIVPLMDEQGMPERYVSIRTDITERKLFEAEMQSQRDFYERISETLGEGLYVQNADGMCTYMNSEAERLLGWSRDEFIGRKVHDAIHSHTAQGEVLPAHACPILTVTLSGERLNDDNQIFARRDGTRFPVSVVSQGVFKEGKYQGAVVAFQDITVRKEAESAMRKAKEAAEEVSRLKSDFLSNMSHEIRTPMNGIIGMTELALDTELNNEQREYLGLVKSSANSLLGIINDILDFSKIEAGRMEIDIVEFSLETMLRETLKALAHRAHQKKLELLLHTAANVPDRLRGDPGRIRQILVNLVGNAIKFTEQGEIEVSVKMRQEVSDGIAALQFSVRDTGIGIPKEKFKVIFESFSQADTSTTRKYGGTGLGLTISAQLVELMGGRIWPESEPGSGSTFFFTLNLEAVSANPLATYQSTSHVKDMRVLVVDDNARNRNVLTDMLRNWKMAPHAVSDGAEALTELAQAEQAGKPYTLALLDMSMPGMNGFELVEKIRQHPGYLKATIMMLISDGQRGDAARCRELGIASYLCKPITQSDLLDAIMTALGAEPPQHSPLVSRPALRESRHRLNLLLAEDNAVNQVLAIRLLEKLGHRVMLAKNGLEAVKCWQTQQFDAILMDVDMPEMNGFEATNAIRKKEQEAGSHIPIIAMTAHAMQGSREECLRAGMDGYISKPIDTDALWQELENIAGGVEGEVEIDADPGVEVVADLNKARGLMDNNQELFEEIVRLFVEDAPRYLLDAKTALEQGKFDLLKRNAHTIKGMVSVFVAERTMEIAEKIEMNADSPECAEWLRQLEHEVATLIEMLKSYQW